MKVVDGGLLTTVQDLGRRGYQKVGVTPSGAMDPFALRAANALVNNDENEGAMEMTLRGATLEFEEDALIAICGANLHPTIADVALPNWRAVFVQRGSVLALGVAASGCRAYLSVAGGFDLPEVMGSKSTYVRARIGGVEGRALRAGDRLRMGKVSRSAARAVSEAAINLGPLPFALSDRKLDVSSLDIYERGRPVRFVRGPHLDLLGRQDRKVLLTERFEVSTRSDRMGYRLVGPRLHSTKGDLISSAVVAGTVQLPPGGEPIVLMADRQTTGGYPMIAHVVTVDLPRVAQLKPGDEIRFEEVTIDDAQAAMRKRNEDLQRMRGEVEAGVAGRP